MKNQIRTIEITTLQQIDDQIKKDAIASLESGSVIYLPTYYFTVKENEQTFLSADILAPKEKNINYIYQTQHLAGLNKAYPAVPDLMQAFMLRFAEFSKQLITTLFPSYQDALLWGRASFRPAAIQNRKISKLKNDTRLHVDSFPSTPVYGRRILRVFCNINPFNQPRVWHLGEPFSQVLALFAHQIPAFSPIKAKLLKLIGDTKTLRSAYDHYMLKLHNKMKCDDHYQNNVNKLHFDFPAKSTWVVFTDQVSHAALSGQFLLEQTFYLPVSAMKNPASSPLHQWEQLKSTCLV